ncbi:DEAD/DEAH box helicase family protein [Rhodospirillum rubrum]|uniref:DEAD/DEAH box helicase family protein n=1 Tax=Rhodospirillum rubrum TaxID=1085 RepID=UPI001904F332|nr:DEAD/DEAH box helicase family protein [Rhodospirillum rubrum]
MATLREDSRLGSVDLAAYGRLRDLWRADPVLYARQRLGMVPTAQQAGLLSAIAPAGAKVTVRAGHGVGKTTATAAAIWWHLECFDYSKTPCTAPTASQLEQILWSELARLRRRADARAQGTGLPAALRLEALFAVSGRAIADRGTPREWFVVARTARRDQPDALQGFHASDIDLEAGAGPEVSAKSGGAALMFVIEEASGVPDAVFEVAEGALSSPGARLLMVGNPTRNTGFFARSHKRDRASFTALRLRCADSPLVDPGYRAGLVRKYGAESNVVRVRADGAFPRQDDDVLIALETAEAALARPLPARMAAEDERRLGVDVARFGDDRTVFLLRIGPVVGAIEVTAGRDTMAVAGRARRLAEIWRAGRIYVDEIGVGAGVVDRLREDGAPVVAVNVAASAPERAAGEERGRLLRDHLWLMVRGWLRDEAPVFAGLLSGMSSCLVPGVDADLAQDLAGELATPRYAFDGSGRVVVESKDAMKRRGLRSPDLADALALTFHEAPASGRVAKLRW